MVPDTPRGIVVLDIGATNTKAVLFDPDLNVVAEDSARSARRGPPPYPSIDPAPILALAERVIPAFDAMLPVDAVVPCTHGSAAALLGADGALALPIMDYNAVPPDEIAAGYGAVAPGFDEVLAPINPACLTLARQLWWQAQAWPDAFARTRTLLPLAQALAHWLGGRAVSELTSWGAQTQLWDMGNGRASSLARTRGWDRLMAAPAPAWSTVGHLSARFGGGALRGKGEIRAGIHDSSANFLRYAGNASGRFALLSTGTWIIGFDADADAGRLDPARDTACGLTITGRTVPICRFKGGAEHAWLAGDAPPPAIGHVADLVARNAMALPNFTRSGGPLPGPEGKITGRVAREERASLAALYCALMTGLSIEAMSGTAPGRVIVDGPFSQNRVYLALLAALLPGSAVLASKLREGTATGAALLALAAQRTGEIPSRPISLQDVEPAAIEGLSAYRAAWRAAAEARAGLSARGPEGSD